MLTISKLQQRDLEALADLHPDYDFETAYLEHLQERQHILVASHKDEDGLRTYFGYVNLVWESQYTPFWRHNIPEIVDLYVAEQYRRQGIASELIKAAENVSRKKGFGKIGVCLEQVGEFEIAKQLYEALGYSKDESGEQQGNKRLSLSKSLP